MSSITTIASGDLIGSTSRTDINTNFSNLNADKIETSVLDTDTALTANSDSKIPTQKAVKAYADSFAFGNASETTKGVVEEATDAEVTAGTSNGATGAKLFITPAKLATYLPVYESDKVLTATISLTSAEIKALSNIVTKTLVAAPGAGKIVVMEKVLYSFTYGSVAYSAGDSCDVFYTGSSTTLMQSVFPASAINGGASSITEVQYKTSILTLTGFDNKDVIFRQVTGNPFVTGDGTLKIFIRYRIVTL